MQSLILKGVKIGDNSIIGAGSVVTSDIPSNVVAAGNPAKVIRQLV
jgi:acetyltransferase-like isoleucine patch superfamily enzyme